MGVKFLVRLRWKVPYYLGYSEGTFEWVDKAHAKRFEAEEAQKLAQQHGAFVESDGVK